VERAATFSLRVRDDDADPERLEQLTARLRRDLQELDVGTVEPAPAGPAPEGARGAELVELGTLLVSLSTAPAVLGALVAGLRSWLGYKSSREIEVEYEGVKVRMKGSASQADVEQLQSLLMRAQPVEP
jgi:hypothetical protein